MGGWVDGSPTALEEVSEEEGDLRLFSPFCLRNNNCIIRRPQKTNFPFSQPLLACGTLTAGVLTLNHLVS